MNSPRLLSTSDADLAAYSELRHAMLIDAPWAYLASPSDDFAADAGKMRETLSEPDNVICVIEDSVKAQGSPSLGFTASAGVVRDRFIKTRHKAIIWGVYVIPRLRGNGLGRAVMSAAIEQVRRWEGIEMLSLSASANSPEAIGLYESLGFQRWGVEPNAMLVDGSRHDEVHFQKKI